MCNKYLLLILMIPSILFSMSIKDIQYTSDSGFDGTYPSLYNNQSVNTEGIVIGIANDRNRYYLSDSQGGPWSSICVLDSRANLELGNYVQVEGKVIEILGMTTIKAYNSRIIKTNCQLPESYPITLGELNNSEAYEAVLVKIPNITIKKSDKNDFPYSLENLNYTAYVGNAFSIVSKSRKSPIIVQQSLNHICGIVLFSNNRYSLNPRTSSDIVYQSKGSQATSWGKIKSLYR